MENVTSKLNEKGFNCIGNLVLLEKLGEGSQGVVYKAINTEDKYKNKYYAVKQISIDHLCKIPHRKELLATELKILNSISHNNIIKLERVLVTKNNYYLVMKYCNQGNYYHYMKSRNLSFLPESEAIKLLIQIANGFYALKDKKVIHRDFKLENILFNNGNLIIGDLGFAKMDVEITKTILGTPSTMAYELLTADEENRSYNSKVDLWSIGCVYYEMLFGQPPFYGGDKFQIIKDIRNKTSGNRLVLPKKVSAESEQLLNELLVKDPEERLTWIEFFLHPIFKNFLTKDVKKNYHTFCIETQEDVATDYQMNRQFRSYNTKVKEMKEDFIVDVNFQHESKILLNGEQCEETKVNFEEKALGTKLATEHEIILNGYRHEVNIMMYFEQTIKRAITLLQKKDLRFMRRQLAVFAVYAYHYVFSYLSELKKNFNYKINPFTCNNQVFLQFMGSEGARDIDKLFTNMRDRIALFRKNLKDSVYTAAELKESNLSNISKKELNRQMLVKFEELKDLLMEKDIDSNKNYKKMCRFLVNIKYCCEAEEFFIYTKETSQGTMSFNWNRFTETEKNLSDEEVIEILCSG